jgi:hypothetical protein
MPAPTESELSELDSAQFDEHIFPDQSVSNVSSRNSTTSNPSKRPRTRKRTAWVWNHMPDPDPEYLYSDQRDRIQWRCKYCPKVYLESGGTHVIKTHLEGHNIQETLPKDHKGLRVQASIQQALERAKEHEHKRRRTQNSLNPDQFEQLYVRWIARCSVPLRMVECVEFRALLQFGNDTVDDWLPRSHNTVKGWVLRTFELEKDHIKAALLNSLSKIHISCDLWTSPNSLAILGMVAHFIAEDGQLRHPVLALRELREEHTGENVSKLVMDVVKDYGIASKLGYFMMDNASNNDTMMEFLSISKSPFYASKIGYLY